MTARVRGEIPKTMSVDTKPGEKLLFAFPENGYESCRKHVREHLVPGHVYTLADIAVSQSSTRIQLAECPGVWFNSVHFININEPGDK